MENVVNILENLSMAAIKQLRTLIGLQRLKLVLKLSELFSTFITSVFILMMSILVFLLLNIAGAIWLGTFFGESYLGFLCLALGYLVLLIMFLAFFRPFFKRSMRNIFIKISLNDE